MNEEKCALAIDNSEIRLPEVVRTIVTGNGCPFYWERLGFSWRVHWPPHLAAVERGDDRPLLVEVDSKRKSVERRMIDHIGVLTGRLKDVSFSAKRRRRSLSLGRKIKRVA